MAYKFKDTCTKLWYPTIVYDEDEIRNQMRRYHSAFQKVV